MARPYPLLMLGFWVLLLAALTFAFLPLVVPKLAPPAGLAPDARVDAPPQPAPDLKPLAGQLAVPQASLFADGRPSSSAAVSGPGVSPAAPVPLAGVQAPASFVDRPGGLFATPVEGR